MATGKVMIFMGDGYGKSAAALGIAMKRASENERVVIIQFLKGKGMTESEFADYTAEHPNFYRRAPKDHPGYNKKLMEQYKLLSANQVKGENIDSAMKRIESSVGMIADAFDKCADNLFKDFTVLLCVMLRFSQRTRTNKNALCSGASAPGCR